MDDEIEKAYVAGKRRWPALTHATLQDFARQANRLGISPPDLERHGTDLYLALGCGMGDPEALVILERVFVPPLEQHLARSGFDDAARQDVFQQMFLHLCTGETPRILTYAARASLSAWLRVTAVRCALSLHPPAYRNNQLQLDTNLECLFVGDCDIEQQVVIEKARPLFQAALGHAIGSLRDRDRTLLRLCYVDGLSIDAIGNMYQVHRATAARWLADVRQRILAEVQQSLAHEAGLQPSEFESLAALVRSELHLSLRRLLGAA